jgi:cellobiose phosphorylase
MYRLVVESLLGLRLEVDKLYIEPCLPADWEMYKVHYRYRETIYHITIFQIQSSDVGPSVTVDGVKTDDKGISLVDDRQVHSIEVRIAQCGSSK